MQIIAENTEDYIEKIPEERQEGMKKLVETIRKNIPKGFTEMMQYNMLSWSISLEDYPNGYHCTPNTPLPFLSEANQKNSINFYREDFRPMVKEVLEACFRSGTAFDYEAVIITKKKGTLGSDYWKCRAGSGRMPAHLR